MNNKKILNTIIIISILIVVMLVIIILLQFTKQEGVNELNIQVELEQEQQSYLEGLENPGQIINGKKPQELKYESLYFTVEGCINTFMENISTGNTEIVYNLLDEKYIKQNNITKENVINTIPKYNNVQNYNTEIMYSITGVNYSTYYVKGNIGETDIYLIVNTDDESKCFSIIPIDSQSFNININKVIETNEKQEDTIEKNSDNTISYKYLSQEDIVDKYFQHYLENALFNIEVSYNTLDKSYRESKFKDLNGYKEYIQKNKEKIEQMCKTTRKKHDDFESYEEYEEYYRIVSKSGLAEYKIETNDEGKQYICKDTDGKYYIFNITSIMNYTVILDTYTIDLPEFIEKYENAKDEEKVLMNIQKFFEAINNSDYKYAYDKLDETFKANNFATEKEFENYVKSNFFENNKLSAGNPQKQGDIYLYDITISDSSEKDTNSIKKTFVMQLKEGTDFVMSFSVQ